MIIFISVTILILQEVIFDYIRIVKKKRIDNHEFDTWLRGALVFAVSLINHHIHPEYSWWQGFILACTYYYLVFDYVINAVIGRKFFYVGKSSWLDKKTNWIPGPWLLFIKLWLFGVGIGIYYHLDKITNNWGLW